MTTTVGASERTNPQALDRDFVAVVEGSSPPLRTA